MRQSNAIAERITPKTFGSVESSQGEQKVFGCWSVGADGRLTQFWCKSRPTADCRTTCTVWPPEAA